MPAKADKIDTNKTLSSNVKTNLINVNQTVKVMSVDVPVGLSPNIT